MNIQRGARNTHLALEWLRETGFATSNGARSTSEDIAKIVILFTNKMSHDFAATIEQARAARLAGITILVVCVGEQYDAIEMHEVSSYPESHSTFIEDEIEDLISIEEELLSLICNGTTIYCFLCRYVN